jgi:16S rRNA (uracil1498-N3)-methyltransferase
MTLPVFAVDADELTGDEIRLAGTEGRHAVAVRRIRMGEQIVLTDTRGAGALCVVRSVSKQSLTAEVLERRSEPPPSPRLVVVQAVPKGDHAERAVDLLTEVGVDEIVPWASTRTVVTWTGEREEKALARWRATAHAAAKQSRRLWFPDVAALHTTDRVADRIAAAALALVLHETADTSVTAHDTPVSGEILLVVGPEGGVTDDELDRFTAAGAHPVRLGPTVLRSSTAGVVAAAAVLSRTPRWS